MSPSSALHTSLLATPDWLKLRAGQGVLCLGGLIAVAKGLEVAGLLPEEIAHPTLAFLTVCTTLTALAMIRPLARDRRAGRDMMRVWRFQAAALAMLAVSALATGAASLAGDGTGGPLQLISALTPIAGVGLAMIAMASMPGKEMPRRHRITAGLDLATLLLGGLLGFWIFALRPALSALSHGGAFGVVVVITAYAFVSLMLFCTLLLMPFRRHEPQIARGLAISAAGSVGLVVAEVIPLCHGFISQGFAATPMHFGTALFALGTALHARLSRQSDHSKPHHLSPNLRFAMPFAAIGLVATLLFTSIFTRELWAENISLLLPAVFAAFILVVVRQTVLARENYAMALEMQRAKEIAESANSARLHFLANISHDLRTPLNGVLGCAQILLREKTFTSKQKELLKTMQGCAEHLRNLINDLLDLSKLEADRLELAPAPFDLTGFLKALVKTFELEAETKRIAIDLEETPTLPGWIKCDRKRLQQILGNLVHNAIKFTDHGRVKVRAKVDDQMLVFDVIDTGCGILPDKIGELFQPFHVVDERSIRLEGTGLGLSICKKLARKMGGDITVQSTLGKGSTFTVRVPLTESEPVVEVQRTVVDYQGRRRRVLIVDDNPANRVVLRTMLEPLDFLIHEAGDAGGALEQIRLAKPDIILMDLMMPGVDGFELCRQVNALEILPPPALLAVSAMAGDDVLVRCRAAGFADLLNKPVHLELLVEALRAHAGVEWTYGLLQPAPHDTQPTRTAEEIVPPPPDELSAFLDLARRGVVRNIDARAEQLAQAHPEFAAFARRVSRYANDFKLRELAEWLASFTPEKAHGPA